MVDFLVGNLKQRGTNPLIFLRGLFLTSQVLSLNWESLLENIYVFHKQLCFLDFLMINNVPGKTEQIFLKSILMADACVFLL